MNPPSRAEILAAIPDYDQLWQDRDRAAQWCADMLDAPTEWLTVALKTNDGVHDVAQLAVVLPSGLVMLDCMLRPKQQPLGWLALDWGYYAGAVDKAISFDEMYPILWRLLNGRKIVAYDAPQISAILNSAAEAARFQVIAAEWQNFTPIYEQFNHWKLAGWDTSSALEICQSALRDMKYFATYK